MALSGSGFFVVQNGAGTTNFTRAGDFTTNKDGYLTTSSGELVMGYPSVNGVANTSAPLQPIQVNAGVTPAVASTNIQISANLDSDTAVGDVGPVSTLAVYDSLGASHELTVSYTKTATNQWSYQVTIPTGDVAAGGAGTTVVGAGTLAFNGNGTLDTVNSTIGPMNIPTFADGATGNQALTGPFGPVANPSITQTSSANSTSATAQDGYPSGTMLGYSIGSDGSIQGTFSSGKTLALGQVAIATFANNQGLSAIGNNDFQATVASGNAVLGTAGTGGRGTITGGAVEQSNVDVATEFSKLIVAQQAYSASAKAVTTFHEVEQATMQMLQ
jgi:flagellar hook protein FlgE